MSIKILTVIKKCVILGIIQLSQNNMMIQTNKSLEKWKMKPVLLLLKNLLDWNQKCICFWKTTTKMYLFLENDNSDNKKAKGVNRNVVATITHNEYKEVLLNNICIRHSMNRIPSKDHIIEANEINNVCLVLMTKYISKTLDMTD